MSSQIYKKYNWQHASTELAICTDRIEGRQVGHALRYYTFAVENNIGGF